MKIFLSYASEDYSSVEKFYDALKKEGFNLWLDKKDLLPGQKWNTEIEKNMSDTDVCLIFISKNSINKIGYVQKELNKFIEKSEYMPENYIYCIPIVLDDMDPPEKISKFHYVKLDDPKGENWNMVVKSLELAESQRNNNSFNDIDGFNVETKYEYEMVNGIPGYQFSFSYPYFSSKIENQLCEEFNSFIKSIIVNSKIKFRTFDYFYVDINNLEIDIQDLPSYFGYDDYLDFENKTKDRDINYKDVIFLRVNNYLNSNIIDIHYLSNKIFSFVCNKITYSPGAIHEQFYTGVFNFTVKNSKIFQIEFKNLFIESLINDIEIFIDNVITSEIKHKKLLKYKNEIDNYLTDDEIKEFLKEYDYNIFSIKKEGIVFHFDPYIVDSYAGGKYEILIPHSSLEEWYKDEYRKIFIEEMNEI